MQNLRKCPLCEEIYDVGLPFHSMKYFRCHICDVEYPVTIMNPVPSKMIEPEMVNDNDINEFNESIVSNSFWEEFGDYDYDISDAIDNTISPLSLEVPNLHDHCNGDLRYLYYSIERAKYGNIELSQYWLMTYIDSYRNNKSQNDIKNTNIVAQYIAAAIYEYSNIRIKNYISHEIMS